MAVPVTKFQAKAYKELWKKLLSLDPAFKDKSIMAKEVALSLDDYLEAATSFDEMGLAEHRADTEVTDAEEKIDDVLTAYEKVVDELAKKDKTIAVAFKSVRGSLRAGGVDKLRTTWKSFKKDFPDFEKNRAVKQDLGPKLDALQKLEKHRNKLENDMMMWKGNTAATYRTFKSTSADQMSQLGKALKQNKVSADGVAAYGALVNKIVQAGQ